MRLHHGLHPALLAVLIMAACNNQPAGIDNTATETQPSFAAGDNGAFMPMAPGNYWVYDGNVTTIVTLDDGPPRPPIVDTYSSGVNQNEYREIGDQLYLLEVEVIRDGDGVPLVIDSARRQDRAGYYLFDRDKAEGKASDRPVLTSHARQRTERIARHHGVDPSGFETLFARADAVRNALRGLGASPPGGGTESELVTLAYPLHPGATWVIREDPLFVGTVEAHERYHGRSAWRVRVDGELLGESDVNYFWYSRCGLVGFHQHFEGPVTNEVGEVVGNAVTDIIVSLIDADVQRGGCEFAAGGGDGGGNSRVSSYPLAVGNRWLYRLTGTLDGVPFDPLEVEEIQEAWVDAGGHMYMKQVEVREEPIPFTLAEYLRQDRDGLYRNDTLGPTAARRFDAISLQRPHQSGPDAEEVVVLSYPLRVGDSWTMLEIPIFGIWTATVEAKEVVTSPAGEFHAFRIRIEHPLQSAGDRVVQWYSREGMVKAFQDIQTEDGRVRQTWELIELNLE